MTLTPEERAAQAAGYIVPEGDSPISAGDDAIRKNAVVSHAGTYWRGGTPLSGSADLAALGPGVYTVWSGTDAAALGLPLSIQGVVEVARYGNSGRVQTWKPRTTDQTPQLWQRHWVATDWTAWTRMDAADTYDWWRGATELTSHADDPSLETGAYTVWAHSAAPNLGLPTRTQGVLEVFRYGREGGIQRWMTRNFNVTPQLWQRQHLSDTWGDWVRIDAGRTPPLRDQSRSGSGFKTLPLAVTLGNSGSATGPSSGIVRYAIQFNAPITRWRVHVANRNARSGSTAAGNVEFAQWQVGREGTAGAIDAPETVIPAFSTDGTGWVSRWVATPIDTGEPLLLGTSYDASVAPVMQVGACWTGTTEGSLTRQTAAPFEVWIEAETPALTPAPAVLGSSSDAGVGGSRPVVDSTLSRWAREHGALPVHYANSGSAMSGVQDEDAYMWTRWAHLDRPDSLLFALGSNDVYGSRSLQEIQDLHAEISQIAADRISPVQYGSTVFQRATGEADTRIAYNDWLMTQPNGLREVFDFAAAIGSPPNPAFDADGVHLNDAGQDALLASIGTPLTAPAPLYG